MRGNKEKLNLKIRNFNLYTNCTIKKIKKTKTIEVEKMKKLAAVIIFLFSVIIANAEKIGFKEAVEMAQNSSSSLAVKQKEMEKSSLTVEKSMAEFYPLLKATASVAKAEGISSAEGASISLGYNIFNGWNTKNSAAKAEIENKKAEIEIEREKNSIKLKIAKLYSEILKNKKSIESYKNSLEILKKEYEKEQLLFKNSLSSRYELVQFEYEMATVEKNLKNSELEYKKGLKNLKKELGIDEKNEIEIEEVSFDVIKRALESDFDSYLKNSLYSKEKKLNLKSAKSSVAISKSNYYPQVDLQASYSSGNGLNEDWNYRTTLTVSYDVFDFGKRKAGVNGAEKDYEIAELNYINSEKEKKQEISDKLDELENTAEIMEIQKKKIEIAAERYNIGKVKYENRYMSVEDFLTIEEEYRNEEREFYKMGMELFYKQQEYLYMIEN